MEIYGTKESKAKQNMGHKLTLITSFMITLWCVIFKIFQSLIFPVSLQQQTLNVNSAKPHRWLVNIGYAWWNQAIAWTNVVQILWCHVESAGAA